MSLQVNECVINSSSDRHFLFKAFRSAPALNSVYRASLLEDWQSGRNYEMMDVM
jgi:hypothetical protein